MGALVQWLVANREWFAFFALGLTAYAATAIQVERRRKPTWVVITISLNTLFFTGSSSHGSLLSTDSTALDPTYLAFFLSTAPMEPAQHGFSSLLG